MDNPSAETVNLMKALVEKAQREPSFVAYALRRYMEIQQINQEQLEEYLGCSGANLLRLALCGRPEPGTADFRRDVSSCARYSGAREVALANLLNVVAYLDRVQEPGHVAARSADVAGQLGAPAPGKKRRSRETEDQSRKTKEGTGKKPDKENH